MNELDETLRAVYQSDLPSISRLTRAAANARDDDGRTPLMHAVLAEKSNLAVIRALIARGAKVDVVDDGQKWTALHFAAQNQDEATVRVLLDAGASADPTDVFGNSPLWYCIERPHMNRQVINLLVAHGADPLRKNQSGMTPADLLRNSGEAAI